MRRGGNSGEKRGGRKPGGDEMRTGCGHGRAPGSKLALPEGEVSKRKAAGTKHAHHGAFLLGALCLNDPAGSWRSIRTRLPQDQDQDEPPPIRDVPDGGRSRGRLHRRRHLRRRGRGRSKKAERPNSGRVPHGSLPARILSRSAYHAETAQERAPASANEALRTIRVRHRADFGASGKPAGRCRSCLRVQNVAFGRSGRRTDEALACSAGRGGARAFRSGDAPIEAAGQRQRSEC